MSFLRSVRFWMGSGTPPSLTRTFAAGAVVAAALAAARLPLVGFAAPPTSPAGSSPNTSAHMLFGVANRCVAGVPVVVPVDPIKKPEVAAAAGASSVDMSWSVCAFAALSCSFRTRASSMWFTAESTSSNDRKTPFVVYQQRSHRTARTSPWTLCLWPSQRTRWTCCP